MSLFNKTFGTATPSDFVAVPEMQGLYTCGRLPGILFKRLTTFAESARFRSFVIARGDQLNGVIGAAYDQYVKDQTFWHGLPNRAVPGFGRIGRVVTEYRRKADNSGPVFPYAITTYGSNCLATVTRGPQDFASLDAEITSAFAVLHTAYTGAIRSPAGYGGYTADATGFINETGHYTNIHRAWMISYVPVSRFGKVLNKSDAELKALMAVPSDVAPLFFAPNGPVAELRTVASDIEVLYPVATTWSCMKGQDFQPKMQAAVVRCGFPAPSPIAQNSVQSVVFDSYIARSDDVGGGIGDIRQTGTDNPAIVVEFPTPRNAGMFGWEVTSIGAEGDAVFRANAARMLAGHRSASFWPRSEGGVGTDPVLEAGTISVADQLTTIIRDGCDPHPTALRFSSSLTANATSDNPGAFIDVVRQDLRVIEGVFAASALVGTAGACTFAVERLFLQAKDGLADPAETGRVLPVGRGYLMKVVGGRMFIASFVCEEVEGYTFDPSVGFESSYARSVLSPTYDFPTGLADTEILFSATDRKAYRITQA